MGKAAWPTYAQMAGARRPDSVKASVAHESRLSGVEIFSRPFDPKTKKRTDENWVPKHRLKQSRKIKNSAGVAPEGTSHRNLAALCNAGGFDGLRGIHDRPRPNKVSIRKKESFLRGASSGESICGRSVAKTSA
jgi:hypothetical protein